MYQTIPASELQARMHRLVQGLKAHDAEAVLISGVTNLYYFTGTTQNGLLFVFADGSHLFLVKKSLERARGESGLEQIEPLGSMRDLARRLSDHLGHVPASVLYEMDIVPVTVAMRYQKALPDTRWVDGSSLLRRLRAVKSDFEVSCIREAGRQVESVFSHLKGAIRAGMREIDISAEAEWAARKAGHQGIIRMRTFNAELYYGVICAGASANLSTNFDGPSGSRGMNPAATHPAGEDIVKPGMPVLVDFMGAAMGYLCDTTRVFVLGEPDAELVRVHDACIAIQNRLASLMKPGAVPAELYQIGWEMAGEYGIDAAFMGFGSNRVRFLGHGVGLEVDEWPVLADRFTDPLEAGMTVAVEPKCYLEDVGGVGVENTFLVTRDGGLRMVDFPDDLVVLAEGETV